MTMKKKEIKYESLCMNIEILFGHHSTETRKILAIQQFIYSTYISGHAMSQMLR